MRLLLLVAGLLLAAPQLAWADDGPIQPEDGDDEAKVIWFYVDDAGLVTFVDSLALVPSRYRDRAQATNLVTSPPPAPAPDRRTDRSPGRATAADPEPEVTPEPETPSPSERLAQLRGERREIVDELGALDEGWSEQGELSDEALERRSVQLEGRLAAVDREIAELEKALRR